MLRALVRLIFGAPQVAPSRPDDRQASSPRWREAPSHTWRDEVGSGLAVTLTVQTGHSGYMAVVGESHYQETLRALAARCATDYVFTARLVPETENPYDSTAVAVVVDGESSKIGYLSRPVAKSYHSRLAAVAGGVTCPARLTGVEKPTLGVILDFEDVRLALGLERVSIDHGPMDYEAIAEYHRLNNANREFVRDTRNTERSDLAEAVSRYRQALATLTRCRELVREKGLTGFEPNQTDSIPLERLVLCLIKLGKRAEAEAALNAFVEEFPHAREMRLVTEARQRIDRPRSKYR